MARSHVQSRTQRKRQLDRMMGVKIRRFRGSAFGRERLHQPEAAPFPHHNAPASDRRYHDARLDAFCDSSCSNSEPERPFHDKP